MATHVQIILREDVEHLGKAGDLVQVRPGYARNFLLPHGMAARASRNNVTQIEHQRQAALARAEKIRQDSQGVADALREVSLVVRKQAGSEGRLYGSVTASDIAGELSTKGYPVDRRKLELPEEQIKNVGSYRIGCKLAGGVEAQFTLVVEAG